MEVEKGKMLVAKLCLTFCDPMEHRGSSVHAVLQARILENSMDRGASVHAVLQARILEWVALRSIRGSSQLRD